MTDTVPPIEDLPGQAFEATLRQVAELACAGVTGCSKAGLALFEHDEAMLHVATDDEAAELDALQYSAQDGPSLDASATRKTICVAIDSETRWPSFCRVVRLHGIFAVLALPLVVEDEGVGALTLFSEEKSGFDERDQETGSAIAEHASVTLASSRELWRTEGARRNLEEALTTRGVIDQAKGILMAREGCSPDEAFEVLRRASQRAHRKVHDLARELVERAQEGRRAAPTGEDA